MRRTGIRKACLYLCDIACIVAAWAVAEFLLGTVLNLVQAECAETLAREGLRLLFASMPVAAPIAGSMLDEP